MIHADTPNAKVRIENYAHCCSCAWASVDTIAQSGKCSPTAFELERRRRARTARDQRAFRRTRDRRSQRASISHLESAAMYASSNQAKAPRVRSSPGVKAA